MIDLEMALFQLDAVLAARQRIVDLAGAASREKLEALLIQLATTEDSALCSLVERVMAEGLTSAAREVFKEIERKSRAASQRGTTRSIDLGWPVSQDSPLGKSRLARIMGTEELRRVGGDLLSGLQRIHVTTTPTPEQFLQKPIFQFCLEGAATRQAHVKCGTDVDLVFDYNLPHLTTIASVRGVHLRQVLNENTDLGLTVIPRGFLIRNGRWHQQAQFRDGHIQQPVRFCLRAEERIIEDAGIHVIFDRQGRLVYEFDLPLKLVPSLDEVDIESDFPPLALDLDDVMPAKRDEKRTATLMITAHGEQLRAAFINQESIGVLEKQLRTLTKPGLADRLGKIRDLLTEVSIHPVWAMSAELFEAIPETSSKAQGVQLCFEHVVEAGALLFDELSADDDFREILERITALPPGSALSIWTDCAFLPWEILYSRPYVRAWSQETKEKHPIQVLEIWGYRFSLECLLVGTKEYKPQVRAHQEGKALISVNVNPTIDEGFTTSEFKPGATHVAWAEQRKKTGLAVDLRNDGEAIRKIFETENYAATLIYVYCHGQNDHPFSDRQSEQLELDKGIVITPAFLNNGVKFACGPIVFLNSCSSGAFSPLSFRTFLSRFRDKQAVGLLATTFPVPATFAALFGREILSRYLEGGISLGEVVLTLRRALLNQRNPLALFYALQCPMDIIAPHPG